MKIIISNTSHGAYKGVVQEIKRGMKSAQESIVLAPDRFTAFVERGLISTLELESSFGLEVMSFTRLANKLIGKDIKKCLTPEGSVMLISKVILDVKDKLCYYKSVAKVDGFATELYAALTALRNSGATVESLREKASEMDDSPLKTKILDIATIYEEYLVQLETSHTDSSTRLIALADFLATHPEAVAGKRFYCTDIYEFSAPELEILRNIDKYAMSLTIGVTSGYDNPNKRIYPDRVIQKLKSVSDGKAEIVRNDEVLPPATDAISRWLFSYSKPKTPIENVGENGEKKVYLRVAKDRYDEILKLATDVIHHVRSGGRYKDIEVFASDLNSYESDIKAIFARYDIPFFIDEKELLSEQTKVRYLLSALAVVKSGFRSVEVVDFCKNPLFASKLEFGEEEVYLFENYVLKHSVEYSRFFSPFTMDERYESKRLKEHKKEFNYQNVDEKLRFLLESGENVVPERVRRKLIETLSPITLRGSVNVNDIVAGVRRVLEDSEEAWLSHVEKLSNISKFYEKCAEQVNEKIDAVLDEIDDVIQGVRTVGEFETILSSMIKTLKIALVPTYLDCVFVGSYDSRFMGGHDVYILGAVSGKLPALESGGIVIGTNDEEALKNVGIEVSPTSYQKVMTNMYAVCDLMKKPHGKLVVSRPEMADGVFLQPSVVLKELQGFLAEGEKAIEEERIDFEHLTRLPSDERETLATGMFATKRGAYHEILKNAMPVVLDDATSNRILPEELEVYSSALETLPSYEKSKLYGIAVKPERIEMAKSDNVVTSVSRLEKFYACPYGHYFAYVLSLKKRQEGEFLGTENGTIIHSVLEQLFNDIRDGKVDETTIEDRVKVYFDNAIKEGEYEYLLEKPQTKRVLVRVKKESLALAKDMYALSLRSEFAPYLMEAAIGKGEIKPMPIKVGEKEIKFKGVIDRIDVRDGDFLIVDYKTYRAKLELKDIYYGQKIQLYLYMKAVKNSLDKRPVGVFYFPIVQGFSKDDEPRYEYQGQFVNDEELLAKIDGKFAESKRESVLPCTPTGKLSGNVYLSPEQLDAIGDYALAVATKGEEAIESGYIRPLPMKEKCTYCDYQDICAYASAKERTTGSVSLDSFCITTAEDEQ